MRWGSLRAAVTSEMLHFDDPSAGRARLAAAAPDILSPAGGAATAAQPQHAPGGGDLLEINSGGRVIFCFFADAEPQHVGWALGAGRTPGATPQEAEPPEAAAVTPVSSAGDLALPGIKCLVLKFVPSRLLAQSEQFANELTRHVGVCAPESRILRPQARAAPSVGARARVCARV